MKTLKGHSRISLWDLNKRYESQRYLLPPWQRDFVWDSKKKQRWFSDLNACFESKTEFDIPGVLLVYSIKNNGTKFINDGANRTICTNKYMFDYRSKHNNLPEKNSILEDALSRIYIQVQDWEYDTEEEAFEGFIRANYGTVSTPKEIGQGILATRLDNYASFWKEYLTQICESVDAGLNRMNCKPKSGRESKHKGIRDTYALFHRVFSKEKYINSYGAGSSKLELNDTGKNTVYKNIIEYKLVELLGNWSEDQAKSNYIIFTKFVNDEIALYRDIWYKIIKDQNIVPASAHLRWVLHLAAWRKNISLSRDNYVEFINTLISKTNGYTSVYDKRGKLNSKAHANLGLSNLSVLRQVCELLELVDFEKFLPLRKDYRSKKNRNLAPGVDESHFKPYITYGEGETFPEPAILNRNRGAKEVLKSKVDIEDKE